MNDEAGDFSGFDREAFLKANANGPMISGQFAEITLHMMRSLVTPERGSWEAGETFKFMVALLARADRPMSATATISGASRQLQRMIPEQNEEFEFVDAALSGLAYLLECMADDQGAKARRGRREDQFARAMERAMEERTRRRQQRYAEARALMREHKAPQVKLSEEQRIANAVKAPAVKKLLSRLKEVDDWIGVRTLAQWVNKDEMSVRAGLHWLKRAGLAEQRDSPKSMGKPQFKQWKAVQ